MAEYCTWYSLGYVVLVLAAVELACLQCTESWGPPPLMCILHQLIDNVGGAAAVNQGPLDDSLQHGIWGGDHTAPPTDTGRGQGGHPSATHKQDTILVKPLLTNGTSETELSIESQMIANLGIKHA